MIEHVQAELAPPYAHVAAGRSAEITVRVHNSGRSVEDLALGLQGRLARWAEITPARLQLFPGEDGAAVITFQVGRGRDVPTGPMPYAVTISSWTSGEIATVVFGTLNIDTTIAPSLEISPLTASGRFAVTYRITVGNPSASPLEGHLLANDPSQVLRFDTSAILVRVEPGTIAHTLLQVRPRQVKWRGPAIEHKFHILLQPRDEDALHAEALLLQLPVF